MTRYQSPGYQALFALILPIIFLTALQCCLSSAYAQGVGQRKLPEAETEDNAELDVIQVVAMAQQGTPTAPTTDEARRELERIPGAIGFVEDDVFLDDFTQSLGDILLFTPGVYADTSAQRESRISVRGSGLNSSFERRGITVLRDGVPITRASGSTEFQEVDPLSIHYVEVYKGANGLRYGAASLGGAINIVSATGRTAEPGFSARLEGGSFGSLRGSVRYAQADDDSDLYISVTGLDTNGFREHSDVSSLYGFANAGFKHSDKVETRFYLTALSDNFELAGSLSLEDALSNPEQAARPVTIGPFFPGGDVTVLDPGPVADDWDRNLDVFRLASRTVAQWDNATLEGGVWTSYRQLDHAITRFAGIIDQQEREFGAYARATLERSLFSRPISWTLGWQGNVGDNNNRRWENISGERGELRSSSDQDASNILLYGQGDLALDERWSLIAGLQYLHAERENQALFNDTSGELNYDQVNPRLGVLYRVNDSAQIFANINRDFEPPSTADLTAGGALDFTPLLAQRSWTAEIGSRGQHDFIAWDIAVYRSWLDRELLDFGIPGANGFLSFTDNADNTIHQGIELGFDIYIEPQALRDLGLQLIWRHVYTHNDFKFDNDAEFGNNQLAGVPRHLYVSELRLESVRDWYVTVNARWVPDGPFADFANTTQVPGYDIWGMTAGWNFHPDWQVFFSVENIFDEVFIANVTTNANQELENGRLFTPGQGRGAFAGISWKF